MSPTIVALISIGSFIVAIITLVFMIVGQRHTVGTDYVAGLEKRIETLERELATAERKLYDSNCENERLLRQNIALLEKLAGVAKS